MVRKKLPQDVIRVGKQIGYLFKVTEVGADDQGVFAIVDVGEPRTTPVYVSAIDRETQEVTTSIFKPVASGESSSEESTEASASEKVEGKSDEVPAAESSGGEGSERLESEAVEDDQASPESVVDAGEKLVGTMSAKQKAKAEKAAKESAKKAEAAPKQIPAPNPIAVQISLKVKLTDDERTMAAKNAAINASKAADAKEAEKLRAANEKAKIKAMEADTVRLTDEHNTGMGDRLVHCEQHFDLNSETTWYLYRGEKYEIRPMDERERREMRNRGLFGDAPLLPNRIDAKNSKAKKSEEVAKDAAAVDQAKLDEKKADQKKSNAAVAEFKAKRGGKHDPADSKDAEIREVMNAEKKKGGKKDHVAR